LDLRNNLNIFWPGRTTIELGKTSEKPARRSLAENASFKQRFPQTPSKGLFLQESFGIFLNVKEVVSICHGGGKQVVLNTERLYLDVNYG